MAKDQNKKVLEEIEALRRKLYKKSNNTDGSSDSLMSYEELLEVSNELDKNIVKYMKSKPKNKK